MRIIKRLARDYVISHVDYDDDDDHDGGHDDDDDDGDDVLRISFEHYFIVTFMLWWDCNDDNDIWFNFLFSLSCYRRNSSL